MTYPLLSVAFLALAAAVLLWGIVRAPDRRRLIARWLLPAVVSGLILVVLTVVFDNAMIAAGLMTYASAAISGVHLGLVPIEDLAYPVAGLLLLPGLWLLLGPRPRDAARTGKRAAVRVRDRSSR